MRGTEWLANLPDYLSFDYFSPDSWSPRALDAIASIKVDPRLSSWPSFSLSLLSLGVRLDSSCFNYFFGELRAGDLDFDFDFDNRRPGATAAMDLSDAFLFMLCVCLALALSIAKLFLNPEFCLFPGLPFLRDLGLTWPA